MNRYAREPGKSVAVDDSGDTEVVPARSRRSEVSVVNLSDSWIYLRMDTEGAEVGKGWPLQPATETTIGGVYYSTGYPGHAYAGPICAIHAAEGEEKMLSVGEV